MATAYTSYTRGSSAYKLAPATAPAPRYRETPAERRERLERQRAERARREALAAKREARAKAMAKAEAKRKAAILCYVMVVFALLSFVVLRYASVATMQLENNQLQSQLTASQTEIEDLKLKVSQATDLQTIRTEAQERLQMDYPKAYQVLTVEPADTASGTPANVQ